MDVQAGMRLCCSKTTEDRFSCIEAHIFFPITSAMHVCYTLLQKPPNITNVTKPIPSKQTRTKPKPIPTRAKNSSSLFDDDSDDDDLFGAGTRKVQYKPYA